MDVKIQAGSVTTVSADVLIVGMYKDEETNDYLKALGSAIVQEIKAARSNKSFKGEVGDRFALTTLGTLPSKRILVMGLGEKEKFTLESLRRVAGVAIRTVKGYNVKQVASVLHLQNKFSNDDQVGAFVEGTLLGDYQFIDYATEKKKELVPVETVTLLQEKDNKAALEKATTIIKATNYVRQLVNEPAQKVTPAYLVKEAEKLRSKGITVTIFDKKKLQELGMGGILAVGQGSVNEPYCIILEYGPKDQPPLAIVGKGITFDSGGLAIKPAKGMEDMKYDMSGAAAILGIFTALSQFKWNTHVVGVLPVAENMPSGSAYRLGDIVTFYNKKTAEINHTDAEGRVVLADALCYAEKNFHPQRMVDMATLTGACVVALGSWASGMISTNDAFCSDLQRAGEESGERLWRLPFWDEYRENMKSEVADVRNSGKGYDAGAIEGAVFLNHFVEKTPWVHLDIAGTAWFSEAKYYYNFGATGVGVRLLLRYLENMLKKK